MTMGRILDNGQELIGQWYDIRQWAGTNRTMARI